MTGTSLLTCQSDAGVISSVCQSAPSTENHRCSADEKMNGCADNDTTAVSSSAVKQCKVESLKAARTKVTLT